MIKEYDEMLYLPETLRKNKRHIFEAFDFLTFDYGDAVYNILLPSLEHYKKRLLDDGLENLYYREFSRFLAIHRIARLRSRENTIIRFWNYFDEFMKQYRGISRNSFPLYLKEAEFRFNVPVPEHRFKILKSLILETF